LASYFLGAALGVNPSQSFQTVAKYLVLLAFFPVAALELPLPRIEKLLSAFTAGAAVCAVYGIVKYSLGLEDRITSFSGHWMVFGGLLMLAVIIQVHLVKRHPRSPLAWSTLILVGAGLLLTQTRGAWLGALLGFGWYSWKIDRRLLVAGALALILGLFLLPASLQERVRSIWDSKLSYSNMERTYMWQAGLAISRDHPFFGIGQGNMEQVYPSYRKPEAQEAVVGHLHNNFIQSLAHNGWVGLLAYLFWILAYLRDAFRFRPRDSDEAGFHTILTASFLAVLAWGLTEYTFSHQFLLFQAFLLGLQWNLINSSPSVDAKSEQ
jgi:O-antigen ligase